MGGETLQAKEAVDLLLDGRLREALVRYRTLAAEFPEQPVFAVVADLLGKRIEGNCRQEPAIADKQCRIQD